MPTSTPTRRPCPARRYLYDRAGAEVLGVAEDWEGAWSWATGGDVGAVLDPKGCFAQVVRLRVEGYGDGTKTVWMRGRMHVPAGADVVSIPLMTVLNDDPSRDSEAGIEVTVRDPGSGQTVMTYASHILDTYLWLDYISAFADVSEFPDRDVELTITLRQPDVCAGGDCRHNVSLYVGDLAFERLPDICTNEPGGGHTLYDYYDDPSPHAGAGCPNPQAFYYIDVEDGPRNAYGIGENTYVVTVDLPAGAEALQFKVYYGPRTEGFAINDHALDTAAVYAAFPVHLGTYVNIAEPSRWMPVNDGAGTVNAYVVAGRNRFQFNVHTNNYWDERPFDLWARFRVPTGP